MATRTKSQAREQATNIVDKWMAATLAAGWIPGSGLISGAADQVMIRQVADCFGVGVFDFKAVTAQLGGVIGAGLGGGAAAELFSLIPIFGWAAKAATLAGKVSLMGAAVIDYFEQHSDLPD